MFKMGDPKKKIPMKKMRMYDYMLWNEPDFDGPLREVVDVKKEFVWEKDYYEQHKTHGDYQICSIFHQYPLL